jgi:hypothetical protein
VLFVSGITLTKDPYYKYQALTYYRANIKKADTLVVSYPSIDDVFIGIEIFRRFQCRLNIDFRDSMLDFPLEKFSWFQKRRINTIFRQIGENESVFVTAVSPPICESLRFFFKHVHCVTNFRENICARPFAPKLGKHVRILFYGSLINSYDRGLEVLVNAIRLLSAKNQDREFSFSFFGKYTRSELASFSKLSNLSNVTLSISAPISIDHLGNYDFAIIWGVPENPGYVSSKFFSYLQLGLPIIAAAEGNQVGEYIREFSVGYSYGFTQNFLVDGFTELSKSKPLYTNDITIFSDEHVLRQWCFLIL